MKKYCSYCEVIQGINIKKEHQRIEVRDEFVEVDIILTLCQKCGEPIYDRKTEIENDIIVFDAYKRKKNMMDSQDIIQMRNNYGTSQETLAKILGFGLKTITRYENGTIQDETHENLLRLAQELDNFVFLWTKKKRDLSDKENKKIQKAIAASAKVENLYPSKTCKTEYITNNSFGGDSYVWN